MEYGKKLVEWTEGWSESRLCKAELLFKVKDTLLDAESILYILSDHVIKSWMKNILNRLEAKDERWTSWPMKFKVD